MHTIPPMSDRSQRFIMRLSPAELAEWKVRAASVGLSVAELIRERMRREDVWERTRINETRRDLVVGA